MIPHNRPTLGKEEVKVANQVIQSGWLTQGPEVELFENELCHYLCIPEGHAVAVSSGTVALYLALLHLNKRNIGYPSYTCSSVRNAILMAQCQAISMDIKKDCVNLDIQATQRKNVDAMIIPHMFGIPADVHEVQIPFIEDVAQSIGAMINQRHVGTFGTFGIFSFSATKLITTGGQGGAIVSLNKELVNEIRDYREFDMRHDIKPRFNFQMTDLQASIGRVQLKKLNLFLDRRKEIFEKYLKAGLNLIQSKEKFKKDVRYRAILRTDRPLYLIKELERHGIKAIVPIEEFELGSVGFHSNAFLLTHNTISLPIFPSLTDWEIDKIIMVVQKCIY